MTLGDLLLALFFLGAFGWLGFMLVHSIMIGREIEAEIDEINNRIKDTRR